ncbi:MAG: hypothetical protein HY674_14410 [Chloroflexi bacterium]|nr:hypothetical protein [Chloroflexota bacterium]
MSVKTVEKTQKARVASPVPEVRYLDKAAFRSAKKRVFARHASLLGKLAK